MQITVHAFTLSFLKIVAYFQEHYFLEPATPSSLSKHRVMDLFGVSVESYRSRAVRNEINQIFREFEQNLNRWLPDQSESVDMEDRTQNHLSKFLDREKKRGDAHPPTFVFEDHYTFLLAVDLQVEKFWFIFESLFSQLRALADHCKISSDYLTNQMNKLELRTRHDFHDYFVDDLLAIINLKIEACG